MDWIDIPKEKPWNEDDDGRLVDLYSLYSQLDSETCFSKLAAAFGRLESDIIKRLWKLKVIGKDETKRSEEKKESENTLTSGGV